MEKYGNDKVFFIVSNSINIKGFIKYECQLKSFKNILTKNRKNFKISVFCFDRNESSEEKIYLNYQIYKFKFEGKCKVRTNENDKWKNKFIFNFQFQKYEDDNLKKKFSPPESLNLSLIEQFNIFKEALKQNDKFIEDLIIDFFDEKVSLNEYLKILKSFYKTKEIKTVLMCFDLNRLILSKIEEIKEINEYITILNYIEHNPKLITKYCNEKEMPQYMKNFYNLLLYFRFIYEKEKVQDLLINEELRKYYVEILPLNYKYFSNLEVSNELIFEMLNLKTLNYDIIIDILSYGNSINNILYLINIKFDIIADFCMNQKKKIIISEIIKKNQTDNLILIINVIEKILNQQINKKKIFISLDKQFWNEYILNSDKIDLESLKLIKKCIIACKKIDPNLNDDKFDLNINIHNAGLRALKNEELIDFIINEDIYFKDKKYESEYFRPLFILDRIDLEKANDIFYEKWNNSNIFKLYSFNYNNFIRALIDKINNIKDFEKIFKLLNYKDNQINDKTTGSLLIKKFKDIIKNYKIEESQNLVDDISFFIYIIDQRFKDNKDFENIFGVKILYQMQTDIYIYLVNNYENISQELRDYIVYFFTTKEKYNNVENLLRCLKNLNSRDIILRILNNIYYLIIKEEELFSSEKEIDSFKLLEMILKEKLFVKFPIINETKYLNLTVNLSSNILNKIKRGKIKYKLVKSILEEKEKRNLFKYKLNILLFNNINDVETLMEKLDERYLKNELIIKIIKLITNLDLENQINEGRLNYIEKKEIKNRIEEICNILPNIYEIDKLKQSNYFLYLFNNANKNEILNEANDMIEQLKYLFEDDWINKIDKLNLKKLYTAVKIMGDNKAIIELKLLRDYFGLKQIDDLYLNELLKEIKELELYENISDSISRKIENNNKSNYKIEYLYSYQFKQDNNNNNLINQLKDKNQIIEQLNSKIIEYRNQINELNKLNNENIENLKNSINTKEKDLITLNNELKNKEEELYKLKNIKILSENRHEEIFTINFMSFTEDFIYPINCKNNDTFENVEKQMYKEYPEFRVHNIDFTVNGKIIDRAKTIKENEIKKNDIIIMKNI